MKPTRETDYFGRGATLLAHEVWLLPARGGTFFRLIHREDGPASTRYWKNGKPREVKWMQNGLFHREDGPAHIIYSKMKYAEPDVARWLIHGDEFDIDELAEYIALSESDKVALKLIS